MLSEICQLTKYRPLQASRACAAAVSFQPACSAVWANHMRHATWTQRRYPFSHVSRMQKNCRTKPAPTSLPPGLFPLVQFFKLPWYCGAVLAGWWGDIFNTTRPGQQRSTTAGSAENGTAEASKTAAAHLGPGVGMLRLVNAHDFVPQTPLALPAPGFM